MRGLGRGEIPMKQSDSSGCSTAFGFISLMSEHADACIVSPLTAGCYLLLGFSFCNHCNHTNPSQVAGKLQNPQPKTLNP